MSALQTVRVTLKQSFVNNFPFLSIKDSSSSDCKMLFKHLAESDELMVTTTSERQDITSIIFGTNTNFCL